MARRTFDDFDDLDRKQSFTMCDRKKKFKSSEASKMASKFNQRKYECPVCGQWHLTKQRIKRK